MKAKIKNEAGILLWQQINELRGDVRWAQEYKFCPERRWRFDFCIWHNDRKHPPMLAWAIEIEGGIFTQGRHVRGKGFLGDLEKYNHAAKLGYRVLRFSTQQVLDGSAIAFIRKVLDLEGKAA